MRVFLIICSAILVLAVILLQQSSGLSPREMVAALRGLPVEQGLALLLIALTLLSVLGAAIWQSDRIGQQSRAIAVLQNRVSGIRDEIAAVEAQQAGIDPAVRHLVGTDPVAIMDDIGQRLTDTEARTSQQQAQNEAVDLKSRIEEIRQRQQALRTQLGTVSEKRRLIEPMLGEVKERQSLIERSLAELEKDEDGGTLDQRIGAAEDFLGLANGRLQTLENMSDKLDQLKRAMAEIAAATEPLQSSESGLKAGYVRVLDQQKSVDVTLLSLEKENGETINQKVDRLLKGKGDIERRIAALTDHFKALETIREDVGTQFQKLTVSLNSHLKT